MANALNEFQSEVEGMKVLCALIERGSSEGKLTITLTKNYDEEGYKAFLRDLRFDYDDGFGGQELFGTIWYTDGTWSDRREYDGSEWWQHQKCPSIPAELEVPKEIEMDKKPLVSQFDRYLGATLIAFDSRWIVMRATNGTEFVISSDSNSVDYGDSSESWLVVDGRDYDT